MHNSDEPTQGRSARLVIFRLFVFLSPLLLGWLMLERWSAALPSSYSQKRVLLSAQADRVQTLVLGSSAAYHGVSPEQLQGNAFNLANASQTLFYDDQLLTQTLPTLTHLRRVVVQVGYVSLYTNLDETLEEWRQYFYWQEWGIPPSRLASRFDVRAFSRIALRGSHFYVSALRASLSNLRLGTGSYFTAPLEDQMDRHGWLPEPPEVDSSALSVAGTAKTLARHHASMEMAFEASNVHYLVHILSLLRERHIEAVLVTTPVFTTYREGMKPEIWRRAQQTFQSIARSYDARYVDNLNVSSMGAEAFYDSDHLSAQGAVRYTRMLAEELGPI